MTDRMVVLRRFEERDREPYDRWLRPGNEWQRLDAPFEPPPSDEERAGAIAAVLDVCLQDDPPRRMVIGHGSGAALIGTVSWYWIDRRSGWPGLGIAIYDPSLWRRGLGTDALRQWCQRLWSSPHAFGRLDLRTWSGNVGMIALARRLGFIEEARFRRARRVGSERFDALGFGLLREEGLGSGTEGEP